MRSRAVMTTAPAFIPTGPVNDGANTVESLRVKVTLSQISKLDKTKARQMIEYCELMRMW